MMENLSLKALLSASTLTAVLMLTGCDQAPQENEQAEQTTVFEQTSTTTSENEESATTVTQDSQPLSRGNMLNIARDIAKLQIETDDYVTLLKQSQSNLEQAIQDKNVQSLQKTTAALSQELNGLHDALLALNLKSTEVDQIRQSLLSANQQLLNMPLLHGQTDLSKIDFAKIEKQFNTIQMDMVKLATLVLGNKPDSAA
ncbi:hypothetical protein NDN11_17275 [Acinetobacter sp. C26M]|uniref:hypothetical protein n=1 Tax=unclassified Acinetobacter TaxID=196816 RepID=UPI002036DF79|nr:MULTISPECIES: hypothetical protein [unclassified Acinetobacter]USA46410.1 hypothetical protein NDN11_17275 [Acinetobacter sp. C26M]USA49894.1 hypothetical protein NDN12_17190 [Acinetobacter sp. C26G]